MHFVCISASNIRHTGTDSTSLRVCRLIGQLLFERHFGSLTTDVIALVDLETKPCIGCGACLVEKKCRDDQEFNEIYRRMIKGDGLFIVSPHYAPIPAKLSMVLEKVEQIAFLSRFHDDTYRSPLCGRPVGIIGHAGGTAELLDRYKGPVLDTIANALSWPIEMKIIKREDGANGVLFPAKPVTRSAESVLPIMEHDWEDIRRRIAPLVSAVFESAMADDRKDTR